MRTVGQAIGQALAEALASDERVVLIGDELLDGGLYGVTEGLRAKFGADRVFEPGGTEASLIHFATGLAVQGLRPIVELSTSEGLLSALGALATELAALEWRSGGDFRPRVLVRCPYGAGARTPLGALSPEALLCAVPGLAVAVPSDAENAAALVRLGLQAQRPVVLLEPRALYHRQDLESAATPVERLGQALVRRRGADVTALCWGAMVPRTLQAARLLESEQIDVEVVDLVSLSPLDEAAVLGSFERTGRPVIVQEAPRTAGFGAELAARIAELGVLRLESPVLRVAAADTPVPYAGEAEHVPGVQRIAETLREAALY